MKNQPDKKWLNALFISSFFHFILTGVFLFGVPSFFEKMQPQPDIMTFEVLQFKDIANVKTESKVAKKEKKAEKSRKVKKAKPKTETKPAPKTKQEPKTKPKPEPKPKTKPEPKPTPKAKPAPKTKEKPKTKPAPPQKKETKKTKPEPKKADHDPMEDILNNLEEESEGDETNKITKSHSEKKASDKTAKGENYDEESPLSITEKLAIQNQMKKYWRPPAGANNLDEIRILIHISLEKTGIIKDIIVKNAICPNLSSIVCKLVEDSAVRALKKASPIKGFMAERYNVWKEFTLEFDPSFAQ